MVGKSVAMVETVSVVGIAMVVEGIGIGFRGISSRLGVSGPLAVVVAKVVSEVAIGKVTMAIGKRVAVVAVVGLGISVGLSSHGSKEAKSSNGHGFHHFDQFAS